MCNGVVDQTEPSIGADPTALRLRLVNGWIWINDLTSGTLWIAGTDTELERIDDWGNTLGSEGDEPDENPGDRRTATPRRTPTSARSAIRRSTRTASTNRRWRATTSPGPAPTSPSSSTSSPTTRIPTATR